MIRKAVQKRAVEALSANVFPQSPKYLRRGNTFSWQGVLCELYIQSLRTPEIIRKGRNAPGAINWKFAGYVESPKQLRKLEKQRTTDKRTRDSAKSLGTPRHTFLDKETRMPKDVRLWTGLDLDEFEALREACEGKSLVEIAELIRNLPTSLEDEG